MLACSSNISSHARAHTRQHLRLSTQPWDWMLQCFLTSHCLLCWVLQTCRPTGSHIVGLAEAADLAEEVYRLPGMYLDRLYLVINGNKVFSQCYYPKFHWREKGRRACCRHAGLLGRDLFCMCVSPNSQLAGILRPACSLLLALAHPGSLSLPSIHCYAPAAHSGNPTLWLRSTTVQEVLGVTGWGGGIKVLLCLQAVPGNKGKVLPGERRICAMCGSSSWSHELESLAKAVP